jgi:hypothetical protein
MNLVYFLRLSDHSQCNIGSRRMTFGVTRMHGHSFQFCAKYFSCFRQSYSFGVWGLWGLWGCETLRIPHFLDTDGGGVVSLTRQQRFTPQEESWYSFLLEAKSRYV